jgi:hypothetical protein
MFCVFYNADFIHFTVSKSTKPYWYKIVCKFLMFPYVSYFLLSPKPFRLGNVFLWFLLFCMEGCGNDLPSKITWGKNIDITK